MKLFLHAFSNPVRCLEIFRCDASKSGIDKVTRTNLCIERGNESHIYRHVCSREGINRVIGAHYEDIIFDHEGKFPRDIIDKLMVYRRPSVK